MDWENLSPSPPGQQAQPSEASDWNSLSTENPHGIASEQAKTAAEQFASGLTLGGSKVAETKLFGVKPEDIEAREKANPTTATLSNIAGGVGLFALPGVGELAAPAEGAALAARIAKAASVGATIGGVNQVNDDWSQNKTLDAQKIAASAGLGALFGTAGEGLFSGIKALKNRNAVKAGEQAMLGSESASIAPEAAQTAAPEQTGVQPTSTSELSNQADQIRASGFKDELPQKNALLDAASRIEQKYPINPAQIEAMTNPELLDTYKSIKETPGSKLGSDIQTIEAAQKADLAEKLDSTIGSLNPNVTSDAVKGGNQASQIFENQYQTEKKALAPVFQELKQMPISDEFNAPSTIQKIIDAVPGTANMFEAAEDGMKIKPYKTSWGIDKSTYTAVKQAAEALEENPKDIQALWNIRKGLDQNIDILSQGQGPREIRSIKAALMDHIQNAVDANDSNINAKEAFKRYAINEQQREIIEKTFGASVGNGELGLLSKVKPENVGDKIFANTANVNAAKKILPPQDFQKILGNWLSELRARATDPDTKAFSSKRFANLLNQNKDSLNQAFSDNPQALQRIHDLTTIMKILPDAASINPSGSAKTWMRMVREVNFHNMTWEGMLAHLPKKIAEGMAEKIEMRNFNKSLGAEVTSQEANQELQRRVRELSDKIDDKARLIYTGLSSQAPKEREELSK